MTCPACTFWDQDKLTCVEVYQDLTNSGVCGNFTAVTGIPITTHGKLYLVVQQIQVAIDFKVVLAHILLGFLKQSVYGLPITCGEYLSLMQVVLLMSHITEYYLNQRHTL